MSGPGFPKKLTSTICVICSLLSCLVTQHICPLSSSTAIYYHCARETEWNVISEYKFIPSLKLPMNSSSSKTKCPGEAIAQKQNYIVIQTPLGFQTLAAITVSPCLSPLGHLAAHLLYPLTTQLGSAFCSLQSPSGKGQVLFLKDLFSI